MEIKGLICPVFTPFTDDLKTINFDIIDKYANYLKTKGVHGVLVNGITGEGCTLRIDERKRLAEEWLKVCRKYGLHMLLVIGGVDITDVYDLAKHGEQIGVDAIVLLPDLFYKPKVEEDLVDYIKDIHKRITKMPLYFHHIPRYTYVRLNMLRFYELVKKEVNTFRGFVWHHDVNVAYDLLNVGAHMIMCHTTMLTGLKTLGFDTFSLITLNIWTDLVKEIHDHMTNLKLREAFDLNTKLYKMIVETTMNKDNDLVELFKLKFDKVVDFKVGRVRIPKVTNFYKKY